MSSLPKTLGAISAIYIGAFIDAILIPRLPIFLNTTNSVSDSGIRDGKPEPYAGIVNNAADIIKECFHPNLMLKGPAAMAPNKHPNSALPTTHPFIPESKSKCLLN